MAYPIPWRLNLAIMVTQVVSAGILFWLTSSAFAWWHFALLAFCFAILGNSIYAMLHEAEHRILLPSRKWNDLFGSFLGLFFPAPFHLLRQGHLGHHYRNRSDDEAFDFYFDGENPGWKWVQLYGILTGFFWVSVILSNIIVLVCPFILKKSFFRFDRPSAALMDSLNPRFWRIIQLEAIAVILFHAMMLWLFQIPLSSYLIVYLGFGVSWSGMQYVHHFGTERDVIHGTRNVWLCRPIDLIWLNHNWHHAHHANPTIPWIYLPEISERDNAKCEFLLWQYIYMWRGPRYTDKHVENRYDGQIIR